MLDENTLFSLLTEDDLPDSDGQPVDNELQVLAPVLLRAILAYIWAERQDWFFGINMGLYYDNRQPAVGPDGFLSLGVPRLRDSGKLRLSYVVTQEQVMPQLTLEIVSQQPGKEYTDKFQLYAAIGILYYVIYNPSHAARDRHQEFEVYKLQGGEYVQQFGNPVWMPEIGLGIGHEVGTQEGIRRDWLYWYDERGQRYLPPENALSQERILRKREQLMRQEAEERLVEAERERIRAEQAREQEAQARIRAEQAREQEAQARELAERSLEQQSRAIAQALTRQFALNLLKQGTLSLEAIAQATGLTIAQLEEIQGDNTAR